MKMITSKQGMVGAVGVALVFGFLLSVVAAPAPASAAVYGYVDTAGEVKSVTAADWMTAIAIAPGIHIHSGVMLLTTAADYLIVGDTVESVK